MGEMLTSLEKDTRSRDRIISEMNENFFVEAGAGSGKTTMLVNRMTAMVEAGIDIGRICAITFTKAAAGEFYERFRKILIRRSAPGYEGDAVHRPGMLGAPTEETRERCRRALENIDLCFMGTIDSFCGMVLSEHPSEAGISSDSAVISDEDAAVIYRQQYVKICGGEYGEELRRLAKSFEALHRNAQDAFVTGISFVMNNRNVRFHFDEAAAVDIDRDFGEERRALIRATSCLAAHPELKYDKEAKSRAAWEQIGNIHKNIRGRWSSSFTNVLYGLKSLGNIRVIPEALGRYGVSLEEVFTPGGKQGKWLECTACREDGLLEKLEKLRYEVSMTFLVRSLPVMEQALRDKGGLTFFDCLYYLRNMLKRDAAEGGKLIRYIYDRHSYFLIDEFQDTNPMQAEVFFYLTAEHPEPRWSDCVPRPGSLFIVGDPKQSIYRFRSADVTSFLKVKRLFEEKGGSILSLSRNFRSTRVLCEYFNRVFAPLLPEETENQSKFEDIPLPEPTEDEFQGVFTYRAYTGSAETEHPDMTDPVRIADIIEHIAGNERFLIRGEKEKTLRPVRFSDFMVITYGKRKLGPILRELEARNIPAKVEGDVPFAENQALYELYLIYAAAADAGDSAALYGALTGGLLKLTKEDILHFRSCGGTLSLKASFDREACADEAALRTCDAIDRLKQLHDLSQRLSPAALFCEIMEMYRPYLAVPAENLEVVFYALELLRNAETSGLVVSLKDGAAYLGSLIAGISGEERCLSLSTEKDCVHMANLHKVKGLEAPIVILAAAGSSTFSGSSRMIHGEDGSEGYIFSLESERDENGKSGTFFSTSDYGDEKAAETEALKAEGQRLIYVAATRARGVLILCESVRIMRGSESVNSKWRPIMEQELPDIFEVIGEETGCPVQAGEKVSADGLYEEAERTSVLRDRMAEGATFRVENPSRLRVRSKLSETPEGTGEAEAVQMADGGRAFAALLGTMTHRLMEMLVTTRGLVDTEAAVREILREYRTPGTEPCEREIADALRKAAGGIRSGGYPQTNGLPQDILGTLLAADEVYCEVPFCYQDETAVWNGVMDVMYLKDGRWHIVDYKTNADGRNLDEKYQAQMSAYERAFRAITGSEADARTYHIDI